MIKRSIWGILGGVFLLALILLGGIYYTLVVGLLVTLAVLEYAELMKKQNLKPHTVIMLAMSLLTLALTFVVSSTYGSEPIESLRIAERVFPIILWLTFFGMWIIEFFQGNTEKSLLNISLNLLGTVYIGFLFAYILLLRFIPPVNTVFYVLFAFLVTWANDSAAYFVGVNFGKHKLCPAISPHKTLEGSLGGLAAGLITSTILAVIFKKPLIPYAILGIAAVVAGQVGDLVESMMKRNAGVKDSGEFLPGHGGVLDRFDSLLFAGPIIYYAVTYILQA